MIHNELYAHAERLAARPYALICELSKPGYLMRHPELNGCKAYGTTLQEALANLRDARTDYIYALLVEGLDVPEPRTNRTKTGSYATASYWRVDGHGRILTEDEEIGPRFTIVMG